MGSSKTTTGCTYDPGPGTSVPVTILHAQDTCVANVSSAVQHDSNHAHELATINADVMPYRRSEPLDKTDSVTQDDVLGPPVVSSFATRNRWHDIPQLRARSCIIVGLCSAHPRKRNAA